MTSEHYLSKYCCDTVKVYLYDIVYKILKLVRILPVATLGLRGFFSYNEHYKKISLDARWLYVEQFNVWINSMSQRCWSVYESII